MKVLSLFDGMACGMLAMMAAGVEVESYDAYEIDKYAVKTATHNFPMIQEHGDVFTADFTQYEGVDFLVGGSPCTYWSIAQTKNRETVASGLGWELFSQYVRALREAKPKYFIYENNKSMSKEIRASIDEAFGFEAVCINSALVSAQNRQRLYWVGKRNADGTYSKVNVEQPEDRGILLKDVLDSAVSQDLSYAEPVPLSEKEMDYMVRDNQDRRWNFCNKPGEDDKSKCVVANVSRGVPYNVCAEPVQVGRMPREDGIVTDSKPYRAYDVDGKAVTQCGQGDGLGAKTGLYAVPVEPKRICNIDGGGQGNRIYSTDAKSCAIKANGGGLGGNGQGLYALDIPSYAVPCEWDENGEPTKAVSCSGGKVYPVYKVENGEITIKDKQYPIKLVDGYYIIRKLTVSECMRLQTVPEWYDFSCVSNSQAYKMLGNGWTVEVIAHLIRSALDECAAEAQARQCSEEFMENIEMTTDREVEIMERAIEKYGEVPQIIIAIEECSELIKALTKWLRYMDRDSDTQNELLDNVREEMADVNIMLNQLVLIFGECHEIEIAKLERLERRLRDET